MSLHQSKSEKSEAQLKKPGRSSGVGHQQSAKGVGVGGPGPSASAPSSRGGKRSNGSGWLSKGNPNSGGPAELNSNHKVQNGGYSQRQQQGSPLSGTTTGVPSPASKAPNAVAPKSNGLLPKPPISQPSSARTLEQASSVHKAAVAGEVSRASLQSPFPLQFGSLSAGLINGMQVPVRTSSAPPNFDEQRHDQARFGAANGGSVAKLPMVSSASQEKLQDQVVSKQALEPTAEPNRNWQGVSGVLPAVQTQHSPAVSGLAIAPPIPFPQTHASSSQTQSQGMVLGTSSLPLNLQMATAVQAQVQQAVFGPQSLQPNTLQSHQGVMHQVQGLNFPQPMRPPLPHAMHQQVNSFASHIPSQHFSQMPLQIGPQLGGPIGTPLPTYVPQPTNQYIPQRTNTPVKITHPETHEELRFGPKGVKSDSHTDNGTAALVSNSTLLAASPTYGPLQSGQPVAFSDLYSMNFYTGMPSGSYSNPSSTFHQPQKTSVPAAGMSPLNVSSLKHNLVRPSSGQNLSLRTHCGTTVAIPQQPTLGTEVSFAVAKVLDPKTSCSASSVALGQSSYGSSSPSVSAATRGEICGSQSISVATEVSSLGKSDAGINQLSTSMSAVVTSEPIDSVVSSSYAVSMLGSGANYYAGEKPRSEFVKPGGILTKETLRTKTDLRSRKQHLQQQPPPTVSLHTSSPSLTSKAQDASKREGDGDAAFSELGCTEIEVEKSGLNQISTSSTSMTASRSVLQKTPKSITSSAQKASSLSLKADNTNALGATSELARKAIGNIVHLSSPDSVSNSLKADKVSAEKQASGKVSKETIGASGLVQEFSSKDNNMGTSESKGDLGNVVEFARADTSYLGISGPISEGAIVAPAPAPAPAPAEETVGKDVEATSEVAEDANSGHILEVLETSSRSISNEPNIELNSSLRDVKIPNCESVNDTKILSLNNDSAESSSRGSEDSGMIEQVVNQHEYKMKASDTLSTLTDSFNSNLNKGKLDDFVDSESVITNDQARSHSTESKTCQVKHSGLASQRVMPEMGTLVDDGNLVKDQKGEVFATVELAAGGNEAAEQGVRSDALAVSVEPNVCILEKQLAVAGLPSGSKVNDSDLSLAYKNQNIGSNDIVMGHVEGDTSHAGVNGIQDKVQVSMFNDIIGKAVASHQPAESGDKFDTLGRMKEESLNSSINVSVKNRVTNVGDSAKIGGNKKKKKKEFLIKADAAAPTGDLYNAYKAIEEKQEDVKSPEASKVVVPSVDEKMLSVMESENQASKELDDWEDAAELSTTVAQVDAPKAQNSGERKYTRDFLMTLKCQFKDLPLHFEIRPDIIEILNTEVSANFLGEGEALTSTGRALDRQLSGSSRLDRRGSNVGAADEDRWTKSVDPFLSGRDMQMEVGLGPAGGFRPGQGFNVGFARSVRGAPGNNFMSGILPGGPIMQAPIPQSGLLRNYSEADRWQRAAGLHKGVIPPPQAPLPAIHRTENRYELGKISDEEQLKQRQIKSILNKLTPQNFDKLFARVKEVNIDSAICLTGVISQIFDKALMEPTFCEMYAKFCVQLAAGLPEFNEDNEKVMFRRVLLNKCQEEFERDEREQAEADKVEEDGEVKLSQEEREEKKAATRRRMLGNIRFIGELYKESMLTERIMHECIKKLLGEYQNPDEEHVEALCKLMSTIGHMIDHPKAKEHIDAYFDRMTNMCNNQNLSSRLKFMLKDLIDLRKNGWQQRRKVEGPKKIEEVHRDAVQERQAQGSRFSRGSNMGSSGRRLSTPPDHGLRGSAAPHSLSGAPMSSFQHVSGMRGAQPQMGVRGFGGQDARLAEKVHFENRSMPMPLSHRPSDDGSLTLGPQGGLGRGMTVRGQQLPSNRSALADVPPIVSGSNRRMSVGPMSGYNNVGSDRMLFGGRDEIPSRSHGAERPLLSKPGTQERNALVHERRDFRNSYSFNRTGLATNPEHQLGHNQGCSSRGNPRISSERAQPSEDWLRKMSDMAIKEFYSVRDMQEAAMCVEDLHAPWFHPTMVSLWVIDSFDKKDAERDQLANLLIHLCKVEYGLLKHDLLRGLEMVLSSLEDTAVDAPKAPEFLGGILGKLVIAGIFVLEDIANLIKEGGIEPRSLIERGLALDALATVLGVVKREKGESVLTVMYRASGVCLADFIPPGEKPRNIEAVFEKKNIECLYPASISRHL